MKVIGLKANKMVLEYSNGAMETNMKANGSTIKEWAKE